MHRKHKLSHKTRHNSLKVIPIYLKIVTPQHFICTPLSVPKYAFLLHDSNTLLRSNLTLLFCHIFQAEALYFRISSPAKTTQLTSVHSKQVPEIRQGATDSKYTVLSLMHSGHSINTLLFKNIIFPLLCLYLILYIRYHGLL